MTQKKKTNLAEMALNLKALSGVRYGKIYCIPSICVCVCVCVCVCAHAQIHTHTHTYANTCMKSGQPTTVTMVFRHFITE